MKTLLVNSGGQKDISQLVTANEWSGDYQQAARRLGLSIAVSPHDLHLPKVEIGLGNMIMFFNDSGSELFRGYVFTKEKSYQGTEMEITVYDGLIYLTKSQMSKNFKNMPAETVTRVVCNELGIIPGNLAVTGINQSFIALEKTGYEIIMKAYTNASRQNGKKYMPMMNQGKLDVIEKGAVVADYLLDNAVNLTESTYSESLENMVNRVIITDDNGNKIGSVENGEWIQGYGLLQTIYKKEQDKDAKTVAKGLLKGVDRKASVEVLGNTSCITGRAIKIKEQYTGLSGLFFIDADSHKWKDGQYVMHLTVAFQNMIDEQEG